MADDDKKVKTSLAPKSEPAAKKKDEGPAKDKSPAAADPAKTASGEAAAAWHEALDRYERKGIIPLAQRTRERLAALQETAR